MRKAIRSSLGRMKWLKYVTPLILPKIVYRQGFMLLFLSNGNSNEAGAFSPFLQKCQRFSIYGAFLKFYLGLQLRLAVARQKKPKANGVRLRFLSFLHMWERIQALLRSFASIGFGQEAKAVVSLLA